MQVKILKKMTTNPNLVNFGTIPVGSTFLSDGQVCMRLDPAANALVTGADATHLPYVNLHDGKTNLAAPTTQFEQVSYTASPTA